MDDDHPAEDLRTANTARLRAGLAQFAVSDAGAGFQADSPAAVSWNGAPRLRRFTLACCCELKRRLEAPVVHVGLLV